VAISALTVWEVRTTGSDTNGGGFVTGSGGTDFSQQDAAQIAVTDGVANGTTTVTSATANFQPSHVGNITYIGGAWYQIISRTSTTAVVVDRTIATATGLTINLGGALATPGLAAAQKVAGNDVWIKSGTYTITTSTAGASGPVNDVTGGASGSNITRWEGYNSTRGDKGTRPVISAGAITSISVFTVGAQFSVVDNLIFDGNSKTSTKGLLSAQVRCGFSRIKVQNTTSIAYDISGGNEALYRCEATACSGTGAFVLSSNVSCLRCEAYGNTTLGFSTSAQNELINCISSGNTGASTDGFQCFGLTALLINCVAYGNGRHGFNIGGNGYQVIENCIAEGNSGWGFTQTLGNTNTQEFYNCAGRSNTSGNFDSTNLTLTGIGFINLTAECFVDPTNGNFALNSATGGGALLRAAAYGGTTPRGTTISFLDIGVAQHRDNTFGVPLIGSLR
jgi:hypothetical protein